MANVISRIGNILQDPPLVKFLLRDARAALLWLPLRIWLGLQWYDAGIGKIDNPAWVSTGEALKGYWERAVIIPEAGRPAIAFDGYRSFIQSMLDAEAYAWFGKLVAYGELLVGIALIVGAFVGVAALFGAFMNWNFMMAGSASSNPMLFVIAIGLILAWKVGGYLGVDFFVLRWLGIPTQAKDSNQVPKKEGAAEGSLTSASAD